ncbi:MAG: PAS domain-containing protein [Acholeplasmatales bacterium]
MKETRWNCYYVLDHKERIKEMSDGMVEELGLPKEEIIGKPLFEILNKTIRVSNFDDIETSNQNLERYYKDYRKTVKPNQFDTHTMYFQNYQGKSVLVQLVEQPLFILGRYKGRINVGERKLILI